MSLSNSQREKLLATVQRQFPLAHEWDYAKFDRKKHLRTFSMYMCATGLMAASAAMSVGVFHVTNYLIGRDVVMGAIGSLVLCFALAGVSLLLGLTIGDSLLSTYKMVKYKRSELYKKSIRDYSARNASVRKVKEALRCVSDQELGLLSKHPKLNPMFEHCFKDELKRREQIVVVQKINSEFLATVDVQSTDNQISINDTALAFKKI